MNFLRSLNERDTLQAARIYLKRIHKEEKEINLFLQKGILFLHASFLHVLPEVAISYSRYSQFQFSLQKKMLPSLDPDSLFIQTVLLLEIIQEANSWKGTWIYCNEPNMSSCDQLPIWLSSSEGTLEHSVLEFSDILAFISKIHEGDSRYKSCILIPVHVNMYFRVPALMDRLEEDLRPAIESIYWRNEPFYLKWTRNVFSLGLPRFIGPILMAKKRWSVPTANKACLLGKAQSLLDHLGNLLGSNIEKGILNCKIGIIDERLFSYLYPLICYYEEFTEERNPLDIPPKVLALVKLIENFFYQI